MSRSRRARGILAAAAATFALVLGSIAAAQPAAADTVSLTGVQANGMAGVTQNLTITTNAMCGLMPVPGAAVVFGTANGTTQQLGVATFQNCVGQSAQQFTFQWIPSQATVWYVYAVVYGTQSGAIRSAVVPVPTSTTVSAPDTVKLGAAVTLTAKVSATSGAIFSPQGTVQFSVVNGSNIGSPVALNQAIPSVAQVQWIPAVLGAQSVVATYTPANVNTASQNSTCGVSCVSPPDAVQVTQTGVNMYLANPPGASAGVPTTLTAIVSVVPPTGSVNFLINGAALASNVPVQSNGYATTTWTPPAPGNYTLQANWTGSNGVKGSAQEVLGVGSAPAQPDQIIVVTAGGTTLTPGATYTAPNGSTITFSSSTASGAAATFTQNGPCSISSNTFTVSQGNGSCRVTATSPGGNGYGPATAVVTVNLVPGNQTAKLAWPKSGNINVGKTITLAKSSQGKTNAGKPISWKVTSGSSICKLSFPSSGAVKLKVVKKGKCTVQASAKGISGPWNPYKQTRNYKGV
jgi:hypothetical protein